MVRTFKALSALLSYPSEELKLAAADLGAVIADDKLVDTTCQRRLGHLIDELRGRDLYDLQEAYVDLFDRSRSLSLHLFEHVHGESRDRGQAMIDLKNLYESGGLTIEGGELPDYLPLFLEFLSTRDKAEAIELLGQAAHIIAVLKGRLDKRRSPYAAIFAALERLAPASEVHPLEEGEADPDSLAALDATWEDAPVTFGPEATPGCKDSLIARLRAARRPAGSGKGATRNA